MYGIDFINIAGVEKDSDRHAYLPTLNVTHIR